MATACAMIRQRISRLALLVVKLPPLAKAPIPTIRMMSDDESRDRDQ